MENLINVPPNKGILGYPPVLVEQHMTLLMEAAGMAADTADTMTTTTDLLAHAKAVATMREKAVKTSCEEYIACKFFLLANGERLEPLHTHLENGLSEGKKPYPTTVEGMKTIMVDYKAPGVTAPTAAKKNKDDYGVALWIKGVTCFGCGKKGHFLKDCKMTSNKERQKAWDVRRKKFGDPASASTREKTKKTPG